MRIVSNSTKLSNLSFLMRRPSGRPVSSIRFAKRLITRRNSSFREAVAGRPNAPVLPSNIFVMLGVAARPLCPGALAIA